MALRSPALTLIGIIKLRAEQLAKDERDLQELLDMSDQLYLDDTDYGSF